jgi:hypothetical protein
MEDPQQSHGSALTDGYVSSHPMVRDNGYGAQQNRSSGSWASAMFNSNSLTSAWYNGIRYSPEFRRHSSEGGLFYSGNPNSSTQLQLPGSQDTSLLEPDQRYQEPLSPSSATDLYVPPILEFASNILQNPTSEHARPYSAPAKNGELPYFNGWGSMVNDTVATISHGAQSSQWTTTPPFSEQVAFSDPRFQISHSQETSTIPTSSWHRSCAPDVFIYPEHPTRDHRRSSRVPEADPRLLSLTSPSSSTHVRRPARGASGETSTLIGPTEFHGWDMASSEFPPLDVSAIGSSEQHNMDRASQETSQPSGTRKRRRDNEPFKTRKTRVLSPDGKRHARAVRGNGGACERCKEKKVKARIF